MGYFSDSRRNWAGAFWAAMAIPLVLDPWNPIWDESGWLEEQFGPPFAPLGPSGGNDYFTPNFWAGRSSETVGRRGPRTSPIVSLIIRGTCGAQSSNLNLQKICLGPPPLILQKWQLGFILMPKYPYKHIDLGDGCSKRRFLSLNKNMHQFRLHMKFKTIFMSNEEKHGHHFDLPLFFNISMQIFDPGMGVWVLSVFKLVSCKPA